MAGNKFFEFGVYPRFCDGKWTCIVNGMEIARPTADGLLIPTDVLEWYIQHPDLRGEFPGRIVEPT